MDILAQQIREDDAQGNRLHAGFCWRQTIIWRERLLMRSCWMSVAGGVVTLPLFYMWVNWHGPIEYKGGMLDTIALTTFFVSCFAFVATWSVILFCPDWVEEGAAVAFSSRDEIWVARHRRLFQRFATREWVCLSGNVSDITSIERTAARNNGGGHYRHGGERGYLAFDVYLNFASGIRYPAGEVLTEDQAYIVVAQLTLARAEMRASIAEAA